MDASLFVENSIKSLIEFSNSRCVQMLGTGVVVPLLWIPAYLIHWRHERSSKGNEDRVLNSRKVRWTLPYWVLF